MVVPRGYIPLLEAVVRIASAIDAPAPTASKPEAPQHAEVKIALKASRPGIARTSPTDSDDPSEKVSQEEPELGAWKEIVIRQCQAMVAARQRLCQALGDGMPRAVGMRRSGEIRDIPIEAWRTDSADHAMLTGDLPLLFVPSSSLDFMREFWPIFLPEAEFLQWLAPQTVPPHSVGIERRLTEWLTSEMKAAPSAPRSKAEMARRAEVKGLRGSERGFDRAWLAAVQKSGAVAWSKPGRKPKSPR